jgi:AcrR family transcriptional regulator
LLATSELLAVKTGERITTNHIAAAARVNVATLYQYFPSKQAIFYAQYENEEERNIENDKSKEHCSLKVLPQDVKYIFIKADSNIPDMISFIQMNLDYYSGIDQKILMSRVVSLDSMSMSMHL